MTLNRLAQQAESLATTQDIPGLTVMDLIGYFLSRLLTVGQRLQYSLLQLVLAFFDLVYPRSVSRSKHKNVITPYDEMALAIGVAPY
jgi:hypothetical protein